MLIHILLSPIPREQLAHDVEVVVRRRELAGREPAAPEFYDHLESSPGFYSTIWRWLGEGHMWTYACVSTGAAVGEQERGLLRAAE